jgi:hypothetical protein
MSLLAMDLYDYIGSKDALSIDFLWSRSSQDSAACTSTSHTLTAGYLQSYYIPYRLFNQITTGNGRTLAL